MISFRRAKATATVYVPALMATALPSSSIVLGAYLSLLVELCTSLQFLLNLIRIKPLQLLFERRLDSTQNGAEKY